MSLFQQPLERTETPDLVMASLPGNGQTGGRVVVRLGSHAHSVAVEKGFDIVAVRSIILAPELLKSGQAQFWLEGTAEVAMAELVTGLEFDRDDIPASQEENLRHAWRAARTGTQLKALYRAAGIASIFGE
jgi:hypothetical protein